MVSLRKMLGLMRPASSRKCRGGLPKLCQSWNFVLQIWVAKNSQRPLLGPKKLASIEKLEPSLYSASFYLDMSCLWAHSKTDPCTIGCSGCSRLQVPKFPPCDLVRLFFACYLLLGTEAFGLTLQALKVSMASLSRPASSCPPWPTSPEAMSEAVNQQACLHEATGQTWTGDEQGLMYWARVCISYFLKSLQTRVAFGDTWMVVATCVGDFMSLWEPGGACSSPGADAVCEFIKHCIWCMACMCTNKHGTSQ